MKIITTGRELHVVDLAHLMLLNYCHAFTVNLGIVAMDQLYPQAYLNLKMNSIL